MQVFKLFMKVLKKNLPVVFIYIGIFLVIAVIMSKNSTTDNSFKEVKLDVSIIDDDNSQASKALTDFIESKHNIISIENNKDKILDAMFYSRVDYVLTIKSGYEEKIKSGNTTELFTNFRVHDSYSATILDNSIDEYVSTLGAYIIGGSDLETAITKTEGTLSNKITVNTESFTKEDISSPDYPENFSYFFQYLPYILISILVGALCPVLLTLNKKELNNRTRCSSVPSSKQTFQIFIGSCVLVLATWIVFMIAALAMYGEMFRGKCWMAVLNSFIFTLIAAGIALLVSCFLPSKNVVSLISNIIGLGMSFLCGVFVPQDLLGDGVLKAARFLPAYWYIKVNNMLAGTANEDYSSKTCLSYIGIELIFAIAMFALVLLITKTKENSKKS